MADLGAKSRRVLKTYGKPGLKRVDKIAFSDAPSKLFQNEPAPIFNAAELKDATKSGPEARHPNADQGSLTTTTKLPSLTERTRVSEAIADGKILKNTSTSIYDAPSSDNESPAPSEPVTARKRRRVTPAEDTLSMLSSDAGLVEKVGLAGTVGQSQENNRKLSILLDPPAPKRRASTSPEPNSDSRPSSSGSQLSNIHRQPRPLKSGRGSQPNKTKSKTTKEAGKVLSGQVRKKSAPNRRARSQTPLRTPSPAPKAHTPGSSTPKQSLLMNEILSRDIAENSPGHVQFKGLSLVADLDDGPTARLAERASNLSEKEPSRSRPRIRNRLIDALGSKRALDNLRHSPTSEEDQSSPTTESSEHDRDGSSLNNDDAKMAEIKQLLGENNTEPVAPSSQTSGTTITYSRQRTYLNEGAVEEIDDLPEVPPIRSRANGALFEASQDSFGSAMEDDDVADEAMNGGLRSIHELRQAGGNARVLADIESTLEDLEDPGSSASRRRNALQDLCTKLFDVDFARQMIHSGMIQRMCMSLEKENGLIQNCFGCFAISLLLCSGPVTSPDVQACYKAVLQIVNSVLGEKRELKRIAKERQYNMSRVAVEALAELQNSMRDSRVWDRDKPQILTPQVLGLRILELAVRRMRDAGDSLRSPPPKVLEDVIRILVEKASQSQEVGENRSLTVHLALFILQSFSIILGEAREVGPDAVAQLAKVGSLLSTTPGGDRREETQTQHAVLKLITDVTNNNSTLCERFSTPELIGSIFSIISSAFADVVAEVMEEKQSSSFDAVILALGSLINFTECSETARNLMCRLRHESSTFLEITLRLFLSYHARILQADSEAEIKSLIPIGFLSVLLATTCLSSKNRVLVQKHLDGHSLKPLLEDVEFFSGLHAKVDEGGADGENPANGFSERLQNVVNILREADGLASA